MISYSSLHQNRCRIVGGDHFVAVVGIGLDAETYGVTSSYVIKFRLMCPS